MKKWYTYAFGTLVAWIMAGCSHHHAPLPTVASVDLARYAGTWYEIGRYPNRFETDCTAVTATYARNDDGTIAVTNRCRLLTPNGEENVADGTARIVEGSGNSKLEVTFFWPFYGDYWIMMLGEEYEYAVVGEPSRKYFWILARTPSLDRGIRQKILARLPALGYDAAKIHWTVH